MIRKIRPRARIVRLLGFPGDDPTLHIDLPGAGAGAVGAVRRAHDFVVLPALAVENENERRFQEAIRQLQP